MMKIFISDAVVSRGYDGAPAIRLFNSENGGEFAVFQVGIRKYDSRAENNHRWVNLKVKAFGDLCERIKKMSLKEGSFISLCGDYDEERWTDKDTGGQKKEQTGNGQDTGGQGQQGYSQAPGASQAAPAAPVQSGQTMQAPTEMPQNFTGYESFSGGQNPFFPG